MLVLLSPSKALDFESPLPVLPSVTRPRMLSHTHALLPQLRALSSADLERLMDLSAKLALLNVERFDRFAVDPAQHLERPAILAFKGDVYTDIEATRYDGADWHYAQEHLRILSGLYGLLRPLDLIQAYRLEMGTHLVNPRGRNLYEFWGDRIAHLLNEDMAALGGETVINLASEEYFRAVDAKRLRARVVQPVFKDFKSGQYKVISFFAKRARGAMANFMVRGHVSRVEDLKDFSTGGYEFSPKDSSGETMVFLRKPLE